MRMEAEATERVGLRSIAFVACDRVADRGELYADLVFATCFEVDFYEGVTTVVFDNTIVSDSFFATVIYG